MSDQETDNESINNSEEVTDCIIEHDFNYNNVKENIIIVTGKDRISRPLLTKYEMVRVLGEREKQLISQAEKRIKFELDKGGKVNKNINLKEISEIAEEELRNNQIPFKIKKINGNRIEIWSLDELRKDHLL